MCLRMFNNSLFFDIKITVWCQAVKSFQRRGSLSETVSSYAFLLLQSQVIDPSRRVFSNLLTADVESSNCFNFCKMSDQCNVYETLRMTSERVG